MRLLPELKRKALLSQICSYARSHTGFLLPDCDLHIQVIPGETEGLYGWIAANYLLGGFDFPEDHDHGKGHHTYGFLDMGGASAQIAFAPNATEAERHANDLKLLRMRTLDGAATEYRVFVTTWLGFGVNEARKRYVQALLEASATEDANELPDPCLPAGLTVTTTGDVIIPGSTQEEQGHRPHLIGTGRFDECLRQTYPLLDKDAPCEDKPCLLHGVHVPAIDFDVNHFVGVSEYWHTTHGVFEMEYKDKSYDFNTYQERVNKFCSQDWKTISGGVTDKKWGKKVDERTALEVCFKASWLINVLHDGIGVPRVGLENTRTDGHNGTKEVIQHAAEKGFLEPFQAVDKIQDVEVSWTLGKMVLYAASQVPPTHGALPVGFGSNVPGIPSDFQYAGSQQHDDGSAAAANASQLVGNDETWRESLFESDSPRRIPGFMLFLFIVLMAVFLWCGRDRRGRAFRRLRTLFRYRRGGSKKRRPFAVGKLLFGGGGGGGGSGNNNGTVPYELILEDGDATRDFELVERDSDESSSSFSLSDVAEANQLGRASGWASPQRKMGFDTGTSSFTASSSSYFDHYHHPVGGGGSSQAAPLVGLGIGPPNHTTTTTTTTNTRHHHHNHHPHVLNNRSGLLTPGAAAAAVFGGSGSGGPGLATVAALGRRSRAASPVRMKVPL